MGILRRALPIATLLAAGATTALAQSPPEGDAQRGKTIFTSHGCYQCHGYQGQGSNAGSRLAPGPLPFAAFSLLVRQPGDRMPPYSTRILADQDLADIYAYLLTIPKARAVADIPLLSASPKDSPR